MDIKIFDIVYYHGYLGRLCGRVMRKSKNSDSFGISSWGIAEKDHLELIESVTLLIFSIGDVVKVLSIPDDERTSYPLGWSNDMTEFVNQQDAVHMVTGITEETIYGKPSYQLDNEFLFCPYHLEKINHYDIV